MQFKHRDSDNRFEHLLQSALKRRMGMDNLSERSGIIGVEERKYSSEVLYDKLDRFKLKGKRTAMNREALVEFVAQEYSVSMTMLSATDAILFCRGP